MASSQEIIQIEQIYKGLNSLNDIMSKTAAEYLKLVKTISDNSVVIKEQATTFENVAKAQKQTQESAAQLDALDKKLAATEAALKQLEDGRIQTLIKNRIEVQNSTKEITLKIKVQQAEKGSTEQLVAVNAILENRLKSVNQTTEEGRKKADLLRGAIDRNNVTIKEHSSALGAQRINIGNYGSALDGLKGKFEKLGESASNLPGFLGTAGSAVVGFGRTLWGLVANPIGAFIAAIVVGLTALYSVFTSTASGGKFLKEVMASVGAIFDVVKQSAVLVIDAFKALFSGEFSTAADLFGKSISNLADNTGTAAKAAWNLVDAQSALNKELTFHISEEANEVNAIQKALFAAKDKTKSDEERLKNLKLVLLLSKEQSEKEVEYAKRQFIIDTDKAALKAKVSGVTADQLRAFIALDAEEQKAALNSSASLKKMWDLIGGSDKFKPLEESYAKVIDADTKYFESNKRTQSQTSTIINEMAKDREDAAKKIADQNKKILDDKIALAEKDREIDKKTLDDFRTLQAQKKVIAEAALKNIGNLETDKLKKYAEDKQSEAEIDKKIADEKEEIAKNSAEKIRDIAFQMASEAVNGIFDIGSAKRDEELSALDKEKQAKLSNSKLTADQKAKIEEEYAKKVAAIKTKQAKADKLQSMFNIALSTAEGIVKAGSTLNPAAIAMMIALGALEMALVAAMPIPKFKDGTKSAPDKGIFGEAGRELMFLRDNSVMMADKPTYFEGNKFKGAKIFSNPETERMMGLTEHSMGGRMMTDDRLLNEMKSVKNAILSKPVAIYDRDYKPIGQAYSNHQEIYLNKLTRNN